MTCAKCGAETDALLCRSCREALENRSRETYHLAEAYHLGTPMAQYGASRQLLKVNLVVYGSTAFLLLAGAIGLVVFSLTSHAGLKAFSSSMQILVFSALIAVAYLVWKLWRITTTRQVRVLLCTEGFVHLNGSTAKVFRWEQLAAVEHKHREYGSPRVPYSPPTKKDWYMVQRKDGVKVRYGSDLIENLLVLGERLEYEASRHGVPVRLNSM